MRYLIALPLSKNESESFIKLRDQYKDTAPKWKITLGPHITLFRPSEFLLDKNKAIELFEKAPKFGKFQEEFEGFSAFMNHSNNAVYSEPKNYDNFKKLRKSYMGTASKIMQDTSEVWPFHPHLTLVNRLDSEPAKGLLLKLKSADFKKNYTFDRVSLYKKEHQDSEWVEIAHNALT
jgi:hypothetical protein